MKPPQPLHIFKAGEAEMAFRHFSDEDAIGKRVIELDLGRSVVVIIHFVSTVKSNANTLSRQMFRPSLSQASQLTLHML